MGKFPNPEGGEVERGELVSIIEKLKSKMPWVKPAEKTGKSTPSKFVEFSVEPPKKEETLREYVKRREEEERIEKIAKAKKDLEERKRLYEKYKSQMDKDEKRFHEGRIREEEKDLERLEKRSLKSASFWGFFLALRSLGEG